MRMLDLFAGRFGWSRAFAARGWECVGVDLVEPLEIPQGCIFIKGDITQIYWHAFNTIYGPFDFICASSPCEQFSVHGMKHFHPNPPYPELGIKLFEHTRALCEASGVPYVMENVRAAQKFVGNAVHHCGPFYLWGSGVPPLVHLGISKGYSFHIPNVKTMTKAKRREARKKVEAQQRFSGSPERIALTSRVATIPQELANCVAQYAERLIEQRNEKLSVLSHPDANNHHSSEASQ